jgi:hypothetical protein
MPSLIPDVAAFERRLAGLPVVKHPAHEVVLTAGSKTGRLLFLRSGAVEVIKDGVQIANVSAPGSVFGDQAVLLDQPHTADVRTVEQSEFYVADAHGDVCWRSDRRSLRRRDPCATTRCRQPIIYRGQASAEGRRASQRDWQDGRKGGGVAKL